MATQKLPLDPKRTALIVVDMQIGFLDDRGFINRMGLSVTHLKPTLQPVKRLVEVCRKEGIPIIFTRSVVRPDFTDAGRFLQRFPAAKAAKARVAGTWDVEIHPELPVLPGDYVVDKQRPSAFYNTNLEIILRGLRVDAVVVCGVTTEVCVESTVRDASFRDYDVVVAKDAVAAIDPVRHEGSLRTIAYAFGCLATVDEVIAALSPLPVR